jgi:hypothetical protein
MICFHSKSLVVIRQKTKDKKTKHKGQKTEDDDDDDADKLRSKMNPQKNS